MLELKFAIYHRVASLSSQASYTVLALHTNCISNSAILRHNYISLLSDLCACVHVKKIWRHKGSHSSSVSGSKKKKKKKKKKKEKHFGHLATFWFGTFVMLFNATGCVVRHENTRRCGECLKKAYDSSCIRSL